MRGKRKKSIGRNYDRANIYSKLIFLIQASRYHFFSRGNKLIRFNARFYQRILFKYDIRSQNHPDVLFALKTAHHPFPYAFRHARGRIRDTPGNR